MESLLKDTRKKFVAIVILSICAVVAVSWIILFAYSATEVARPAEISEVHSAGETNEAYAEYLNEQKEYEAHFVTLASDIKQQEADRIQGALLTTTIVATLLGVAIALYTSQKLIKPVEEAYQSQERFIQDAAHELRNPLAAITASLQQTTPSMRKTDFYRTVQRQTKRLIHINEDLLFLERQTKNSITTISLDELLQDVVEELQPLATSKKIELDLTTDKNIIKTMSAADYIRMVKNIIDNAVKYSPKHSTVVIEQRKIKNTVLITVTDKGIGIPKKELPTVGDRFFRAKNTGNIDGTGLGIAIVKKILNVYGGTLAIESAVNKGTQVTIKLPA